MFIKLMPEPEGFVAGHGGNKAPVHKPASFGDRGLDEWTKGRGKARSRKYKKNGLYSSYGSLATQGQC